MSLAPIGVLSVCVGACLGPERPTDAALSGDAQAPDAGGADAPDGGAGDAPSDSAAPQVDAGCPARVPGLVMWLDSSSIVSTGGSVSAWSDLSGHGLDLKPGNNPPLLGKAMAGGRDVVLFDGQTQYMWAQADALLAWGTDDYLVEVVASWTNSGTSAGLLFSHSEAQAPYWGPSLFANVPAPEQQQVGAYAQIRWPTCNPTCDTLGGIAFGDTSLGAGTFHVVGMRRRGGTAPHLDLRVGGTVVASTAVEVHDVSAAGSPLDVGGNGGNGQGVAGAIAAIVAVHAPAGTTMADGDVDAVEACLRTTYGL